jgi:predicted CoA-binding protein
MVEAFRHLLRTAYHRILAHDRSGGKDYPLERNPGGVGAMTSMQVVEEFIGQPCLAIVGVSRGGKKFGNIAHRELLSKGYRVYIVHPEAESIEGAKCYRSLAELPEPVGGVLVVVPPGQTQEVVRQAAAAGIRRVWMQQGAESPEAVRLCEEHGISHVKGECILMFAKPRFPHNMHRLVWRLLGRLPA